MNPNGLGSPLRNPQGLLPDNCDGVGVEVRRQFNDGFTCALIPLPKWDPSEKVVRSGRGRIPDIQLIKRKEELGEGFGGTVLIREGLGQAVLTF
jgi:hypothetical protein